MLRRFVQVLGILVALGLAAAVALPLLISPQTVQPQGTAREAATPQSRFATIPFLGTDGIEIHYLERPGPEGAAATPFLLLHGFTFNAFTWGPTLDAFAARGRTVAYDQIPYGLSAKLAPGDWSEANPYAKESAIAQVFAVMDALGLPKAILVGNSSGGTLALEAALAQPQRVAGLILVAPLVYVPRPGLPTWVESLPQAQRLALYIGRRLGDPTLVRHSYAHPERVTPERQALATIHTRLADWDLAWGALLDRSLSSPVTVSQHLAQIAQPTLVVTGDTDKLVKVEDSRRVAEALPHGTFAMLPDCGHAPQEECPAAFMQTVADWLNGARGPGRGAP